VLRVAGDWRYAGRATATEDCERPRQLVNVRTGEHLMTRCGVSSRARCAPCSVRYRRRVGRVFMSGWEDRPTDRVWLITLTAPGEREHFLPNGEPCPCTPAGGINVAAWNAGSGQRWSWFVEYMRRHFGGLEFAKGVEIQKRGAIHFHALVRCDADLRRRRAEVRAIAMRWGFGHSVDVAPVDSDRAAWYVAKYVSKSTEERERAPWIDRSTGEVTTAARYRCWSASRQWGASMAAVKASQARWCQVRAMVVPATAEAPPDEGGAAVVVAPSAPLDHRTGSYTAPSGITGSSPM
jgi:hypothetical protein